MNKDVEKGEIVIYNGYIPDHIDENDISLIEEFLIEGDSYTVYDIYITLENYHFYKIAGFWYPKESFDLYIKDFKNYYKNKYNLR